jgi:hypothetical protein
MGQLEEMRIFVRIVEAGASVRPLNNWVLLNPAFPENWQHSKWDYGLQGATILLLPNFMVNK